MNRSFIYLLIEYAVKRMPLLVQVLLWLFLTLLPIANAIGASIGASIGFILAALPNPQRDHRRPTARLYLLTCVYMGVFTAIATGSAAAGNISFIMLPFIVGVATLFVVQFNYWQEMRAKLITSSK